jgi:hypothetical protein
MTTSTQTPEPAAKTVARKTPAAKKAAAKPAAAKAAPAKVAEKATSTNIRWSRIEGTGTTKGVPVRGVAGSTTYEINGSDKSWSATKTVDGVTETLVEGVSRGTAYNAAIKAHKGETAVATAA